MVLYKLPILASAFWSGLGVVVAYSCQHKKTTGAVSAPVTVANTTGGAHKICVFGKGGSGKSTLSWLLAKELASQGKRVLAIDADFNLDLMEAFGASEVSLPKLNASEKDFYAYQKLNPDDRFRDLPKRETLEPFSLSPMDSYTRKYSYPVENNLSVMSAGGHNPLQLFGNRCSHAYIAPLKYYLAALETQSQDYVVVDAVAGTDMVTYGLCMGADALVTVVGKAPTSVKVYKQITAIAQSLNIPNYAVFNQVDPQQETQLPGVAPLARFGADGALGARQYENLTPATRHAIAQLISQLHSLPLEKGAAWKRFQVWDKKNTAQTLEAGE